MMKDKLYQFLQRLRIYKQWRLWLWRKSLDLDKHQAQFDSLYRDISGFTLSKIARAHNDAPEYLYGEIEFLSFVALLGRCKPNQSTIFYDLGSGLGKAVLSTAMVFNIKQSIGIELFPTLFQASLQIKNKLAQTNDYQQAVNSIQFIQDDFRNIDIKTATLIFINATAFFGETWVDISKKLEQVTPGCLVITTSKTIISEAFQLQEQTWARMSWGIVKAFIQYRT